MTSASQQTWLARGLLATSLLVLSSCTMRCGAFTYCEVPERWPIADTFTVEAQGSNLCVSGAQNSGCATRGMFPSGSRVIQLYAISDDDEEDDTLIASLTLQGAAGDEFTASCFQYNGRTVLGLKEVLVGVDVTLRGRVVATHPSHPVTRRSTLLASC